MSHLQPPRVESPLVALQDTPNILSEFPMRVPLLRLYRRLNIPIARRDCRICMGLITRTRYLVPVVTSKAAQSLQTGRVDMAWQGMLCEDKRGDPPGWKVEGACMEETGAVSDRPPHAAYSLHAHASRRARTEKMSAAFTLERRYRLLSTPPLGWPACSLVRSEAAEDTSGSARKRGHAVKDCHVSYMQTGKSCRL
jgi:hypothetical protein